MLFYYETGQQDAYRHFCNELSIVYPIHADQQIKLAVAMAKTGNYLEAFQRFKRVDRKIARSHLSFYKWFSLAAHQCGNERLANDIWEDGCIKYRTLSNQQAPWLEIEQMNSDN